MLILRRARGFTVIEIAITLVIFGVLLAVALPSYTDWLQNSRARDMTESFMSGLMLARTEAIKRGTNVRLDVVGTRGWTVSDVASQAVIQNQPALEHLGTVSVTAQDSGGVAATSVIFTGLGVLLTPAQNNAVASPVSRIDIQVDALAEADRREYSILIAPNGSIRWCDRKMQEIEDPRSCDR
ncbi:GspH/FimT family pseudopilin [Chitinivorax sp. PXF-14]|uniref:GspH/FimT family pseudopilin n=1 Tax=Chitinivorax sp. PXF-14 TaxID=3230488 RepID=UPI003465DA91